jgi:putative PIN family toxin of toxin-antitoxin system
MKAVLDTNVLISAIFYGGIVGEILNHWQEGAFTAVVSEATTNEYRDVIERFSKRHTQLAVVGKELLDIFIRKAIFVDSPKNPLKLARDPKDDIFLECAEVSGADYLVSGDKDLLVIGQHGRTQILKPRAFLDVLL